MALQMNIISRNKPNALCVRNAELKCIATVSGITNEYN